MADILYDDAYSVTETDHGPVCGNHPYADRKIRHADAANILACYQLSAQMEADAAAEAALDLATERYYEDRGYWDAIAQNEYERRLGVIPFDEAYRMACPELFADEED